MTEKAEKIYVLSKELHSITDNVKKIVFYFEIF